jgi:hypothetical protein
MRPTWWCALMLAIRLTGQSWDPHRHVLEHNSGTVSGCCCLSCSSVALLRRWLAPGALPHISDRWTPGRCARTHRLGSAAGIEQRNPGQVPAWQDLQATSTMTWVWPAHWACSWTPGISRWKHSWRTSQRPATPPFHMHAMYSLGVPSPSTYACHPGSGAQRSTLAFARHLFVIGGQQQEESSTSHSWRWRAPPTQRSTDSLR